MQAMNLPALPASIALVDLSHMLTGFFKSQSNDAGPNDAGQQTLNALAALRQSTEHVIVCLDSPPYWRKTVYPEYKAGREREPEYGAIYKWTVERIEADGYNVARAKGEEADDVIATLATIYTEEYGCTDVRIVGADKDALQLVTESVRCFVPKGRGEFEIRGPEWVKEKYEVEPKDFALMLAIMGDTSDKIPGIKGIGQVGAAKLITTYKNPAGMAVACTAAVEASKVSGKLPAFWRNYAAGMADLPKWQKLTTLNRDAELELHPLKYVEKLPVQKLVEEEPSDADDSEFIEPGSDFWDNIKAKTEEQEREELAAALPVGPPKADPVAEMNTSAPRTPERIAATRAQIDAGNAAERARLDKLNEHDRFGVKRPDPTVLDPKPDPMRHVPEESQAAIRNLGEQLGKEAAASAQPSASSAPAMPATTAAAEVVPKTQGPAREPRKIQDEITSLSTTKVDAPNWALATQPGTAAEMLQISKVLINSRFYSQFGTPQGIFAVLMLGRELGLGTAASLQGFFIVQNKPFASSALLRALVQRHPDCAYFVCTHSDEKSATYKLRRKSWPEGMESSLTYTWEQAVAAKLTTGANKENWLTKPTEMLSKTAAAKLARREFSDATLGLHTEAELE